MDNLSGGGGKCLIEQNLISGICSVEDFYMKFRKDRFKREGREEEKRASDKSIHSPFLSTHYFYV